MSNDEDQHAIPVMEYINNLPRSSRVIQNNLEVQEEVDGIDLSTYHVVEVSGEEELEGIRDEIITHFLDTYGGAVDSLAYLYCDQIKYWTNPMIPRINNEAPEKYWITTPEFPLELGERIRINIGEQFNATPFNYDKYRGKQYFCSDRTCVDSIDSIRCPTCVRRDEDISDQ